MRPLRLWATILVMMLLVSGIGVAQEGSGPPPDPAPASSALAGVTVSCSLSAPSWLAGCWVERPVLVLGGLEVALGLDVQAALGGGVEHAHLAPYGILAYYGEDWSTWVEARLPQLAGVPVLGSPDWLSVGFTYTVPP